MPASASPHQTRAHRWPLFVGTIAATALLLTALLDFGDPLQSARDEVELGAAARADAVRATWSRLCATAEDPVPARRGFAVEVPDAVPAFAQTERAGLGRDPREPAGSGSGAIRAGSGSGSQRRSPNMGLTAGGRAASGPQVRAPIAAALARAARAARSQGSLDRAVELASIAADRARGRDPVLLAQILLDRCRWAAAAQAPADVVALRLDLITNGDPSATIDSTSVRLLAAMIAPIDAVLARTELESSRRALPPPNDRLQIVRGEAVITWDPWWTVLEQRLHGIAPGIDWARRLHRSERRAEAVRRFFGNQLNGADAQWRFAERFGATFALRRQGAHTRVLHTTEAAIVQRLSQDLAAGSDQPYTVQFHRGGLAAADALPAGQVGDVVRALEALDGERLGFTVHRKDAFRTGQAEANRLSAVRAGLITLAVAILCATMLATRALQRTRRLERMRSTFVASVTHDLRTPIQSILLMAETLERGRVAREASRKRYFTTIRHEAQRLRRFVEDILESARIDRGEAARVDRQAVSSAAFFATMEQDLRQRAERDGATVAFVLERMPEELTIDPDGVLRITWNLFENALRYGRVDDQPADVRVVAACANGVLTITVQDDGPGVPSRFASSIFEPFERADAEERGPTGTGLGLSIVRAIARAHGGDAQLLPSTTGARFAASLPLTPPAPHKDPAA
ncbi:MAG: sensor histidine kinase [Planctomycetota bacterium]